MGLTRHITDGIQGVLSFFLLLGSMGLPFLCCVDNVRRRESFPVDFFQPGVIVAIFFYLYIWIPAFQLWYFLDYSSNWLEFFSYDQQNLFNHALISVSLGLIGFGIGYKGKTFSLVKARPFEPLPSRIGEKQWRKNSFIILLSIVLIIIGMAANLSVFLRLGGFSKNILEYLSPSMFFASEITIPGMLDFFTSFLVWGALLLFYNRLIARKNQVVGFIFVLLVFFVQYVIAGGKRSYIAPLLILPIMWHHYLRKRIGIRRGFVYLGAGFVLMAVLLLFRIVVPLTMVGGSSYEIAASSILQKPIDFYFSTPELAMFDMIMLCIRSQEEILVAAGGWVNGFFDYNISPGLYFIPRMLWADKPVFHDIGQLVYSSFIGPETHVGFAIGIFGVLYLFGGIVGTFVGMVFLGVICKSLYSWLRPFEMNPAVIFGYSLFIWILFMFLRFGTIGFTILFVTQKLFIGVVTGILLYYFYNKRNRKIL